MDIGSSSAKIIELRRDDAGYAVTAAGIVDIAASDDDKNRRETNTIMAIRDCLQSSGTATRLAVCGVSGPEVAVRDFKFPRLPTEEIEGAVMLEAAQVCPFNVDDASVDYQLMGVPKSEKERLGSLPDGEDKTRGVLVAATNRLIKSKKQLAKTAYLNCALMDVDGLALLNCFSECEKPEVGQTTAVLNVGSSYTTLGIVGDNNLPFIRDMAYAGDDIVREIAAEEKLRPETVSKILSGTEDSTVAHLELHDSLEKACWKLIVDVTETLRYYSAQEKSTTVEKIFVCGGFALVKGFVELLNSRLPAEVSVWNPFGKIPCDAGTAVAVREILAERGTAMAVAAGLAMREI